MNLQPDGATAVHFLCAILTSDLDLRRATAAGVFVASSLVVPFGNIALAHSVNPLPTHEKANN